MQVYEISKMKNQQKRRNMMFLLPPHNRKQSPPLQSKTIPLFPTLTLKLTNKAHPPTHQKTQTTTRFFKRKKSEGLRKCSNVPDSASSPPWVDPLVGAGCGCARGGGGFPCFFWVGALEGWGCDMRRARDVVGVGQGLPLE